MEIEILFEDDDVLCVNKPPHLTVHKDGHTEEKTLVDWVKENRPDMEGVGEPMRLQNGEVIDRPGIVHRLDRDTSGVLVLAKNQNTFEFLKEQFKNRKTQKTYKAFVWGEMLDTCGTINKPIGRSKKDFRLWSATVTAKGTLRDAVTRWTCLHVQNGFSYLALEPKTGRTHQIRVHLKAVGHPVVCDTRYAPKKGNALGFTRLALHAQVLSFTHPNGSTLVVEAPFPEDFKKAIAFFESSEHTKYPY